MTAPGQGWTQRTTDATPGERYSEGLALVRQIQRVDAWKQRCRDGEEVTLVSRFASRGLRHATPRVLIWLKEIHGRVCA